MRKILDQFYLVCGILAACSMLGIVLLIASQIVARFFHTHIPSSDDISGYMVAWSTFFGLSYAMNKKEHIRVDLVINFFSTKVQNIFFLISSLLGTLLLLVFLYYVFILVRESYVFKDVTSGYIVMPLWMIQLPYLLGVFALFVSVLDIMLSCLSRTVGRKSP